MSTLPRLDAFIAGKPHASGGGASTLLSPIDLTPFAELIECPEATVGAAVETALSPTPGT